MARPTAHEALIYLMVITSASDREMTDSELARIGAVASKELKQLRRDRLTFGMVVGLPLMQIVLFGYAINMDVRHLRAAVADQANTSLSRALVADIVHMNRVPAFGPVMEQTASELVERWRGMPEGTTLNALHEMAGLTAEIAEVFSGEDRIWSEFEASGDAAAFGAKWAAFARASVSPTLAAALDGGPTGPRAADFVDRLEAGVKRRLAQSPGRMLIPLARMSLLKAGD